MLGSHRDWAGNSNIQKLILVTGSTRRDEDEDDSPFFHHLSWLCHKSRSHSHTVTCFVRLPVWEVSGGLAWLAGDNPGCRFF